MKHQHSTFKGVLLISGTSIGGGMLALPVLTAQAGFLPSLLVFFLCWAFMASTGLLFLEILSKMKKDANIISMAEKTLGEWGKWAAWVLYLFLFYCLTVAYIVGCGDLVMEVANKTIPEWLGSLLFILIFSPLIFLGAKLVGKVNLVLMMGLFISYIAFIVLGAGYIQLEPLLQHKWQFAFMAFPIAFTSFAYQGTIPTLYSYMDHDLHKTKKAIIIGSFLPFIVYAIWQGLILSVVPVHAPGGLLDALNEGDNAITPLRHFINNPSVYIIGQFFAFFALVTSFLGVTLGLLDFLSDGLSIKKTVSGKILLCSLIFIPPLIISFTYPGLFLMALDYAGGFGCALLLGLMPVLMVWSLRYHLNEKTRQLLGGGKWTLGLLALFVIFEITCQLFVMATR